MTTKTEGRYIISVDGHVLHKLHCISHAASKDEARWQIGSVAILPNGLAIATDGKLIAFARVPDWDFHKEIVIPASVLRKLKIKKSLRDDLYSIEVITPDDARDRILIQDETGRIESELLRCKYPNVEPLIDDAVNGSDARSYVHLCPRRVGMIPKILDDKDGTSTRYSTRGANNPAWFHNYLNGIICGLMPYVDKSASKSCDHSALVREYEGIA
jgi:hypothetical protein